MTFSKIARRPAAATKVASTSPFQATGLLRLRILAMLVIILCGGSTALGQRITGSITGTVNDPQGAVVPSATIKATNVETGFSRTVNSGADGAFLVQYLPVGRYRVEVTATGFKKYVAENVVIAVDQTNSLSATLTLGAQAETVEVTAAPPLVDTTTAALGSTISPSEVVSLPLVNRNVYAEISLTPGVMANSSSAQSNANGTPNFQIGVPSTQVQINGGIDAGVPTVSYYLDGGINMTGLRNYGNPLPNPDALQEFRVEANNFGAEYGRMSGAVVTAVTKSGTNEFHGSLFEFNRNTALNAIPWNQTTPAHYRRNQFGGTVGGPVKHDKAFFFSATVRLRQIVGTNLTGAILPGQDMIEGDFTSTQGQQGQPDTGLSARNKDPVRWNQRLAELPDSQAQLRPHHGSGPHGAKADQQVHHAAVNLLDEPGYDEFVERLLQRAHQSG